MDVQADNKTETEQTQQVQVVATTDVRIYAYGSAECDQYYIDEERSESKRPIELTQFFTAIDRRVFAVACGGLHAVVLTTNGEVYTFGCNDDGALGREGDENKPGKVNLDVPINMISAGDSHSIACNSTNSVVFHWGTYRNVHKGNISQAQAPHRIGEAEFKKKTIKKILSGAHHTLVLADGKIFAWGDADAGILGRLPTSRRKLDQGLKIEGMGIKGDVDDIFTGAYHSFLKKTYNDKKKNETYTSIFAWGLNNAGQLGIGTTTNTHVPVEIIEFRGKNIVSVCGGEHHSIALAENGEVYSFGKNDEGQLGLGEDYEEPEEEMKDEANEEKKEDDKKDTDTKFVKRPRKVNVENIVTIASGTNFNYGIAKDNAVYSWGMGDNYVLGTREEDTEYEPKKVPIEFFKSAKIHHLGLGAQHVIFIGLEDANKPPVLDEAITKKEEAPAAKPKATTPRSSKKIKVTDKKEKTEEKDEKEEDEEKKEDEEKEADGKSAKKTRASRNTVSKKKAEDTKTGSLKKVKKTTKSRSKSTKKKGKNEESDDDDE